MPPVPVALVVVWGAPHCPFMHAAPPGHTAPLHASTHAPPEHTSPAAQVLLSHPLSTQWPLAVAQTPPAPQALQVHASTQAPPSQTLPFEHVTPSQGSTHYARPGQHTWLLGQVTPSQGPAHTHLPWSHTSSAPQSPTPSSTAPLQSLSSPSHTSALGFACG